MSAGKQAARDTRYGRRGGNWAEGDRIDVALKAIATARNKGVLDGTWPTVAGDVCPYCRGPVHRDDRLTAEIAGRARMAAARRAAGQPLDTVDVQVLATRSAA